MYKFSIIMPAYNAEKYLSKAIESVLVQSYSEWELIIVNDGSIDSTAKIAGSYAEKDCRIKVISQKNSGTAAAARNTALKYVTGEYVQILDSDDYISSNLLESYSKILSENQCDIIVPIAYSVNDDGKIISEIATVSGLSETQLDGEEAFKLSLNWTIHGWFCVKNDIIQKIKYDPLLLNGDELTTRKLFYNASKILFSTEKYFYRYNIESTTKSSRNSVKLFDCLITDGNIFDYAIENNMKKSIIRKCANKWAKSILAHQAKYQRESNSYSDDEKDFIMEVIQKSVIDFRTKAISYSFVIWRCTYCEAYSSYKSIRRLAIFYNFLRKIKKF